MTYLTPLNFYKNASDNIQNVPDVFHSVPESPVFTRLMEERLQGMLSQMTDPSIPFYRTEDRKTCAICDFTQSIGAMRHCTCNYIPHMAEYFGMDDLIAMAFPKLYIQVSGVEDAGFWIKGARDAFARGRRIYDECEMKERIALVEGPGGHRFYPDLAWPIVHKLLSR